jgi:transglutaminase-like putative cysteine protease
VTGSLAWHPTRAAVALLTAATTYLTLRSWSGISADPGAFLSPLLAICLVLALSGLALRAARVPALAVVLSQIALVALVLNHEFASSASVLGWVPTPTSVRLSVEVFVVAGDSAQEWATPVPARAVEFPPLLIGVGAVVALLVEVLVGTLRRVPLAGLPLLAALTLPVSLLGGVPVLAFAAAALTFALLLAADQTVRLGHWGLGHWDPGQEADDPQAHGQEVGLPSTLPPAAAVGAVGVVLAVMTPLLLPTGLGVLERFGGGPGSGQGGPLELTNPMLNMQRDLVQGSDDPLVEVRTDDPDPSYLRLTVLDAFDGDAWRPSTRDIPPTNQAADRLPLPPGLRNGTPTRETRSSLVATSDFESQWLPTPYPATEIEVSGDWRFDSETLDIVGSETTFTQAEVVSLDVRPDPDELVSAPLPPTGVDRVGTDLPDDVPGFIEERAREVTEGATSDFERIVMLQRWFRDDGGFRYTLDTAPGNGLEQLELFLGTGPGSREGYCEQFAAAMALMARSLGIPARVAVGFLEPDPLGPGRFVYSRRDLHAWPEVYFEGAGWTLFDPTPSARVDEVPGYTAGPLPSETDVDTPDDLPSDAASEAPRQPRRDDVPTEAAGATETGGDGPWLPLTGGVLLVLALLGLPRALRAWVRRNRLHGSTAREVGAAEGAWAEVRATALDLGLYWDDGASLRRQAVSLLAPLRRVRDEAGAGTSGSPTTGSVREVEASLERLVLALERGRYSRWGLSDDDAAAAPEQAEQITTALTNGASARVRRRARWLPVSLWRARRVNTGAEGSRRQDEREQMLL